MSAIRESDVERAVVLWARDNDIIPLKLSGPGDRGKPDRVFLAKGQAVFVEFKAPGKHPTALQLRNLIRLHEAGFHAAWFDNSPNAISFLRDSFDL